MPDEPQITPVEREMTARITAKISEQSDIPEAMRDPFTDLLGGLLTALLSACTKPTPGALAKTLKNPGVFARNSIRRQARREASRSGKFSDSQSAGDKAASMLHQIATESSDDDLVAFIQDGRVHTIPDGDFSSI